MKPMLKAAFFTLVNDLLAKGFTPTVECGYAGNKAHLLWEDAEGRFQVEPLYQAASREPNNSICARFEGWLAQAVAAYKAPLKEAESMTPTAAIQHMAYTLTGLIEQSKKPGFVDAEAYADIQSNLATVNVQCSDLATLVWLKNHHCAGYIGTECSFEDVNEPYLNLFNHILETGWRPGTSPAHRMTLSNMFELEWWDVQNIAVTKREGADVYGTASVTDTEGEYQIAFEWRMETGSKAESLDLPAIVYITAGSFVLPYDFSILQDDGTPMNALEAIEEMDCALGFSSDIFNNVYHTLPSTEAANQQG